MSGRGYGAYWRYPLHLPALSVMGAGGYRLWYYGVFFGSWSVGVMVRRPGAGAGKGETR